MKKYLLFGIFFLLGIAIIPILKPPQTFILYESTSKEALRLVPVFFTIALTTLAVHYYQ